MESPSAPPTPRRPPDSPTSHISTGFCTANASDHGQQGGGYLVSVRLVLLHGSLFITLTSRLCSPSSVAPFPIRRLVAFPVCVFSPSLRFPRLFPLQTLSGFDNLRVHVIPLHHTLQTPVQNLNHSPYRTWSQRDLCQHLASHFNSGEGESVKDTLGWVSPAGIDEGRGYRDPVQNFGLEALAQQAFLRLRDDREGSSGLVLSFVPFLYCGQLLGAVLAFLQFGPHIQNDVDAFARAPQFHLLALAMLPHDVPLHEHSSPVMNLPHQERSGIRISPPRSEKDLEEMGLTDTFCPTRITQ
eukprot:139967-Rhodomonas_salina.1